MKSFNVILMVFVLIIFMYGYEKNKKNKKIEAVNRNYKNISTLSFSSPEFVLRNFFPEKLNAIDDLSNLEIINTYISIAKPITENKSKWYYSRGYVDKAYYIAYAIYEQARAQWISAGNKWYSLNSPSGPDIKNFITYTDEFGETEIKLRHSFLIASKDTEFQTKNFGTIRINVKPLLDEVFIYYKEVINRILSDQLKIINSEEVVGFSVMNANELVQTIENEIINSVRREVSKKMTDSDKDFKVLYCKTIVDDNIIKLPIILTLVKNYGGEILIQLRDVIAPSYIIGELRLSK